MLDATEGNVLERLSCPGCHDVGMLVAKKSETYPKRIREKQTQT